MPILPVPFLLLIPIVALACGLALIAAFGSGTAGFARQSQPPADTPSRHCQYCMFGRAYLVEERTRCENRELIDVRCFACKSCGLPHWVVERTPLIERVR
jgi:hypothetical protein